MKMNDQLKHDTFSIERHYRAAPEKVFAACAEPAQKRKWFVEGEGWIIHSFEMDFREGGLESSRFRPEGGPEMGNDTFYHCIVPGRRIVSSYSMTIAGKPLSVSLATLEFEADGHGTRLVYTEQAVFFEGADGVEGRREGCKALLQALAVALGES